MSGDLPEDVYRDAGVGQPGQSGVAEAVSSEMFESELGDDVVPVRGVAKHGGGDSSAAWAGEQSRVRASAGGFDALLDDVAHFDDQWDGSGALAFGAFVDQTSGGGGGLAANGPEPAVGVDVTDAAAGDFADPGCSARSEDDQIAPASEVTGGSGHERIREAGQ